MLSLNIRDFDTIHNGPINVFGKGKIKNYFRPALNFPGNN